jgi:hypothetical protein
MNDYTDTHRAKEEEDEGSPFQDTIMGLFAIKSDHPDVEAYNGCREDLIDILIDQLGSNWLLMSIFRAVLEPKRNFKPEPCLVIMVQPEYQCNWRELENCLRKALPPPAKYLRILFLPGASDESFTTPPGEPSLCGDLYRKYIHLGKFSGRDGEMFWPISSKKGEKVECTGGGVVGLQIGNKTHWGYLTSHTGLQKKPPEKSKINRHGFSVSTSSDRPQFLSPLGARLMWLSNDWEKRVLYEITRNSHSHMLLSHRRHRRIDNLLNNSPQVIEKHMPPPVRLLLASGRAIRDKHIQDWAFVEMSEQEFSMPLSSQNILKPAVEELNAHGYIRSRQDTYFKTGSQLSGFGKMELGKWYFKSGNKTMSTVGICNGATAVAPLRTENVRFDMHGNRIVSTDKQYFEDFVMFAEAQMEPFGVFQSRNWNQVEFSWLGDAGSWVIDQHRRFCGLLRGTVGMIAPKKYANNPHFFRTMGLVSSVDHILPCIAERAGQDIVVSLNLQGDESSQTCSVSVPFESK